MHHKTIAVIAAAGSGSRFKAAQAKQFMLLQQKPVLSHVLHTLEMVSEVEAVIIVVPAGQEDSVRQGCVAPFGFGKVSRIMAGGRERQDSVLKGVEAAYELGGQWVLIHDAARPLASPDLFRRVIAQAWVKGAAIAAIPCQDTIKQADQHCYVERTLDRQKLWQVQTPQVFRLDWLRQAQQQKISITDEAALLENAGRKVSLIPGEKMNFKITTPEDMTMAEAYLSGAKEPNLRMGQGFDVHRLVPGRPLILGGVAIAHEQGLLGHSDADVLAHAVMDALLAAAGLGDIGRHFPDNDPSYKNADSLELMVQVRDIIARQGWRAAQVNATIIAQKPKLAPHMQAMRQNLSRALGLDLDLINIAATTTEGLGLTGREEGIAAMAQAVLRGKPF